MHAWLRQGADGGARGAAPGAGAGADGAAVTFGDGGQGALTLGAEPWQPPVVLLAARRPALRRGRHAVRLMLAHLGELALGDADRRALVALGGAAARRIRRRRRLTFSP